ncbi:protein hob1 [Diplogelasinospora grovesii]|uniref:Protein hob1 n=1 Tax=Diplogelasinospora grovesii TaxID=303347 RepID=A0AAN6NDT6_9PEZI|nr:protein hob1 [Diplogelasinospora grovesii]
MQSMQRQFGKLWSKGPGDNAKVSVMLNDYEDADRVLAKIIDDAKLWRDSWVSLLNSQLQIVNEYEGLYDPIVGATDGHGREAVPTPQLQLHRTFQLKEAYAELKSELAEELEAIESRLYKPCTDARDYISPIRKTIKNRENKRLDYEKCQEKLSKLHKKSSRSPKEDAALAKAEDELSRASDEFGIADDHLRQTLPPIIDACFRLIPPLLTRLVLIQTRLLGLYYTSLHGYCEDNGFPSPPPPMTEVIATWNSAFRPIQSEVESINCIARGKAIHQSMSIGNDGQSRKPSVPAPSSMSLRKSSSGLLPRAGNGNESRTMRIPSTGSLKAPSPTPSPSSHPSPTFKRSDYLSPTDFTTATILGGAAIDRSPTSSPNRAQQARDYFSRPSTASTTASYATTSSHQSQGGGAALTSLGNGFVKKKPPPPPPPKRIASTKPEEWVVAQYAFAGEGLGDLSFREGDNIKVIKKTESTQDWWTGELNGARGSFPANYCKPL